MHQPAGWSETKASGINRDSWMAIFQNLMGLFKASIGGVLVALVLSPLAILIAKRVGLLDIPGSAPHKKHLLPMPIAGGIVLISGLIVLIFIFQLFDLDFSIFNRDISGLLPAAAIVFLFGLWDDVKGLKVPYKFIGQLLASFFLLAMNVNVHFLASLEVSFVHLSPFIIVVLDWAVSIIWLVGITNAFNFVDSMDGLAVGIAGIAFAFFMLMALLSNQNSLAILSAGLMGICIGLYAFNITPARLFLGDSGAQTLGFILAAVAMIYTPLGLPQSSSWFIPVLLLGVPIFDVTLVILSRILRHKPVFVADRTHTYHRLVGLGLDPYRAVLTIQIITILLGLLAFLSESLSPMRATLLFFTVVLAGILLLIIFLRMKIHSDE
jgi:UDP-GlcNAc:undecaprenyl-phosphate/decaprenyl-phosphate GlcNAc-1-phosphate transferase